MFSSLLLASGSPRRKELLTTCKIPFQVINHQFDEESIDIPGPKKLAALLAAGKAASIADQEEHTDKLVLGVDTIVAYKNRILGKPKGRLEANQMVRLLSGKTHSVMTGVSLQCREKNIVDTQVAVSKVTFTDFDEKFIQYYLDNKHFEGYAGGYAIQGLFGLYVQKIQGSYSNIVGLPVETLYAMLQRINFNFVW